MMAVLGGKATPTKEDIVNILSAIGSDTKAIDADIDRLLTSLEGKDIDKLIEDGMEKVGVMTASAGGGGGGGAAAAEKTVEKKKEESSEEESEKDMGFGLFG